MSPTILLPIIFASLILCLLSGLPLAFSLGGLATIYTLFLWGPNALVMMISNSYGVMWNFVFVAVPLFIFMAMLLGESGITEDLYDAAYKWLGFMKGGLLVATVVVSSIVAAMTGITATAIVALGIVALPQMLKYKYDKNISIGCIITAGSLGELIPPSTVMVIYCATTGISLGHIFAGGVSAGIILSGIYIAYVLIRSYIQKDLCPSQPVEDRATLKEKIISLVKVIAPIFIILSVLGSVFTGAATPTEAAGVGVLGVFIVCVLFGKFNLSMLRETCISTVKISAMVAWITMASVCYSSMVLSLGAVELIMKLTATLPGGAMGALVVFLAILFFLGMFIDPVGIIYICAPLFVPVMRNLGVDLLWFSLLFMVMLQVAYITPPFGYSLFYMAGVAPKGTTLMDVYKSSPPFIGLQLIGLAIFIFWPEAILWLPHMIK